MDKLLQSPIFGILLSLLAYILGVYINKKTKISFLNPLLISISIIVFLLLGFNIPLDNYNIGGNIIGFFLTPATVVLAIPLYKKIEHLKSHALPIILGIIVGCISGIICIILLGKCLNLDETLILSLIPKSVTTPIGIELSNNISGIPSITVAAIIITGILGAVLSPTILKLFKIKNKVSIGVSIGTSAHALGTTKAIELGELEGAMSSVSIGIAGIVTVVVAPILINIFF